MVMNLFSYLTTFPSKPYRTQIFTKHQTSLSAVTKPYIYQPGKKHSNNAECTVNKMLKCKTANTDYGNNVIHTHLFWKQIDIRLVSAMWSIE